jgi:hypothetical protein
MEVSHPSCAAGGGTPPARRGKAADRGRWPLRRKASRWGRAALPTRRCPRASCSRLGHGLRGELEAPLLQVAARTPDVLGWQVQRSMREAVPVWQLPSASRVLGAARARPLPPCLPGMRSPLSVRPPPLGSCGTWPRPMPAAQAGMPRAGRPRRRAPAGAGRTGRARVGGRQVAPCQLNIAVQPAWDPMHPATMPHGGPGPGSPRAPLCAPSAAAARAPAVRATRQGAGAPPGPRSTPLPSPTRPEQSFECDACGRDTVRPPPPSTRPRRARPAGRGRLSLASSGAGRNSKGSFERSIPAGQVATPKPKKARLW